MKRWRVEVRSLSLDLVEGDLVPGEPVHIVYAPTARDAARLLYRQGFGSMRKMTVTEVGSVEQGVLKIPEEEALAVAASYQTGPVKPAKGKRE